ncbi:hypothetical protein Gohar_002646 [Gossypium harknessii]|uniref:RNase H type-1 domain-containing protein n=1 Tax=Gossypium harknessii TaxID=34285 RepID=A0A7J9HLJ1_9ROSI|nr:hypothetical protein [Gossypium harknessii]
MAKEKACLQAVTTAEEMGFQDICVEGDALAVIKKLNFAEEDRSCISTNKAAHVMALEGRRYEDPQYWMENVSRAVEGLVKRNRSSGNDGG